MIVSQKTKIVLAVVGAFLAGGAGTALVFRAHDVDDDGRAPGASVQASHDDSTAQRDGDNYSDGARDTDDDDGKAKDADKDDNDRVVLSADAAPNAGIKTEMTALTVVRNTLSVPGVVDNSPNRMAKITPPVTGKAAAILVRLGQNVRAGQPLVVLESADVAQAQAAVLQAGAGRRDAEAKVETAMARLREAEVGVANADANLKRQREFARLGSFSQAPLQAAQSEQASAQAGLLQARTDLQVRETSLARARKLFQAGVDSRAEFEQAEADERQARIEVQAASTRADIAGTTLERERKVFNGGLLTAQAVQTAQSALNKARAEAARLTSEVDAARTDLAGAGQSVVAARTNLAALTAGARAGDGGQLTILAPISGSITTVPVTLGETIDTTSILMTLQNLSSVVVNAGVDEGDVARIHSGEPVEVTVAAFPGREFHGTVQSIAGDLDPKTRTLTVRCVVPNSAGLMRPRMFGQVSIDTAGKRTALLVPRSAVLEDTGAPTVYVDDDNGYEARQVETGSTFGDKVEIVRGLKPGERVVVDGAFILKSQAALGNLKDDDD